MNQTITPTPSWYTDRQDAVILAQLHEDAELDARFQADYAEYHADDQAPHAAAHTPGPFDVRIVTPTWLAIGRAGYMQIIAMVDNGDQPLTQEDKANAALLAAAPELLELARTILLRLDLEAAEHPGSIFPCAAMRDDLRNVITKATTPTA